MLLEDMLARLSTLAKETVGAGYHLKFLKEGVYRVEFNLANNKKSSLIESSKDPKVTVQKAIEHVLSTRTLIDDPEIIRSSGGCRFTLLKKWY